MGTGFGPSPCLLPLQRSALLSLHRAECEGGRRVASYARAQNRAGKTRVVRRIREMLCLKAEALVLFVLHAVAAGEGSIEEVAGVELHAGLGGFDRHAPAALGVGHDGDRKSVR